MTGSPRPEAAWRKSSHSGGSCVEVAQTRGRIAVRDSKAPADPYLFFSHQQWNDLLLLLKG